MNPAESYILGQSPHYKEILRYLDKRIQELPQIQLRYRWKIPFYYLNDKPFCYLNQSKDFVDLGFWDAREMKDLELEWDNRKMIGSLRYRSIEEVDVKHLQAVLERAVELRGNS